MSNTSTITRRRMMQTLAAAAAIGSAANEAGAQPATIPRADTLIATGQPTGGAPTFAQYNDFNPFHPGLDLRSSIAFGAVKSPCCMS